MKIFREGGNIGHLFVKFRKKFLKVYHEKSIKISQWKQWENLGVNPREIPERILRESLEKSREEFL